MTKTYRTNFITKYKNKHSNISKFKSNLCLLFATLFIFNSSLFTFSTNATMKKSIDTTTKSIDAAPKNPIKTILEKIYGVANYDKALKLIEKEQKNYDSSKLTYEKMLLEVINENETFDAGKSFIDQIIYYNNRLNYYDFYIKFAKARGYVVTSYVDYLKNYKNTNQKVLILRHDIDDTSDATKLMFEIEKKNNVKATYYFRWKTFDKQLIDEISKQGFEVGLHYETIATYCIKYNKYIVTEQDLKKCREILKKEIKDFKLLSGVNIETIASHGNPVNKAIGVPNNVLFYGQKYSDYGVLGETYDRNILKYYIKSYICDADLLEKSGYSYSSNPIDSIMKGDKVIEFLSHPNHWYYDVYNRARMYIQVENGDYTL